MAARRGAKEMTKRKRQEMPPAVELTNNDEARQDADFFGLLQHLSPEEWNGHKVYIYRIWPVIDKRDEQHYVAKLSEPFDEEVILRNWGSGKYLLKLNNGKGESVASKTVSLHNLAFPPKVSPDEVVQTDPRNERYFKAWPIAPQAAAPPADSAAVHELSKLATRVLERENASATEEAPTTLTSTLVKWALEQTSKEREGGDPSRIAALLKELKTLIPQQQPADGLAVIDRVLSIVEKLNSTRAKPDAQDPLEYVTKVLSLADRLRPPQNTPPVGDSDAGNLSAIAAIVHEAAELLKDPLRMATQVWAASRNKNSAQTAPVKTPEPATTQSEHPTQSQAARPAEAAKSPPGRPSQDLIALANSITPVMLKWLHSDAPGGELGEGFAEWVADGWGVQDLKSIQEIGTTGILELYRNSPVWIVLAPMEAKFQEFVGAFVAWQPDDDSADDSADGSPSVIDLDAA
jgi:hypothetical protein